MQSYENGENHRQRDKKRAGDPVNSITEVISSLKSGSGSRPRENFIPSRWDIITPERIKSKNFLQWKWGAAVYRRTLWPPWRPESFFLIKWKSSPPRAASGLSGFTRTTGERVTLPLPGQEQKLSLHIVSIKPKRYQPKQRQATIFFPYKMEITLAPKRLVAQRRRREGACTLKGHRQPSSRSKRDLLGGRSGNGAGEECPILNWVFRMQRSPPRRGFPKGRVPLGVSPHDLWYQSYLWPSSRISLSAFG